MYHHLQIYSSPVRSWISKNPPGTSSGFGILFASASVRLNALNTAGLSVPYHYLNYLLPRLGTLFSWNINQIHPNQLRAKPSPQGPLVEVGVLDVVYIAIYNWIKTFDWSWLISCYIINSEFNVIICSCRWIGTKIAGLYPIGLSKSVGSVILRTVEPGIIVVDNLLSKTILALSLPIYSCSVILARSVTFCLKFWKSSAVKW